MANLLKSLTDSLSFDFSGNLKSDLSNWTEQDIFKTFVRMITVDARIRGAISIRRSKVTSFSWDVLSRDGNEERALEVYKMLEGVDFIEELKKCWNAIPFGISVCEVIWDRRGDLTVPVKLVDIPNSVLVHKPEGPLIKAEGGIEIETWKYPYKYVVCRHNELFNNPEGLPVLAVCYWPWVFKRLGWRQWNILLEKFGVPSLVAMMKQDFPISLPEGETGITMRDVENEILRAMDRMKSGGNAALSNVDALEPLEALGRGDDYQKFLTECNNEISIGILGNTMTMDAQSRGSQALGTVHQQISEQVAREDTTLLAKAANQIISWFCAINYGVDVEPPLFVWDMDGEVSWDAVLQMMDRGVPVSRKAIYYKIRGYEPEDESDALVAVRGQQDASGEVGMSRPFAFHRGGKKAK